MAMREFANLSQHPGSFRRLFTDDYFDLYIWYDAPAGEILGFQLVYDRMQNERALTWGTCSGYSHDGIDTSDSRGYWNSSPVLVADGPFARDAIVERFRLASEGMEEPLRSFILHRLEQYGTVQSPGGFVPE